MDTGFAAAFQAFVDDNEEHSVVPSRKLRANQVCVVCHQPKSDLSGSLSQVTPKLRKHVCSGVQCLDPRKCICSEQIELCKHFHSRFWAKYIAHQKKKIADEKSSAKQKRTDDLLLTKKKKKTKQEEFKSNLFAKLETAKNYIKENEEPDPNRLMNLVQDVLLKSEGIVEPNPASVPKPIALVPVQPILSESPVILSVEEELIFQQKALEQQLAKVKEVEEKVLYKKSEEAKFPVLLEMIQSKQIDVSLLLPFIANNMGFNCSLEPANLKAESVDK